jgi:hypothetical protein
MSHRTDAAMQASTNKCYFLEIALVVIVSQAAVTPDGYFAMPEERLMSFDEFFLKLREKDTPDVFYLSHQNDNLRQQIGDALAQDVPASISFVDEALGLNV